MRRIGRRGVIVVVALLGTITGAGGPAAAIGDDVVSLGYGDYVGCASKSDQTLWCWGQNGDHQVGDGGDQDRFTPVQVQRSAAGPLTGIIAVAPTGYDHMCALKADRTVRCWGDNLLAALGDGTQDVRQYPVITQTATGPLSNVKALAGGSSFTCALLRTGTIRCWGINFYGQVGDGTTDLRMTAVKVLRDGTPVADVSAIATGHNHAWALKANGTVLCWGRNHNGQLGIGTADDDPHPAPVLVKKANGDPLSKVIAIGAGSGHTCALLSDTTLRCWGRGEYGQLGDDGAVDVPSPVKVKRGAGFLTGVVRLSVGANHTCAVTSDGKAWCFGDNSNGELGIGETPDHSAKAVRVRLASGAFSGVTQVRAGDSVSCFLKATRTVWCTGYSEVGGIGSGTTADYTHFPERVAFP